MFVTIINWICILFLFLGGLDFLTGNHYKLGEEFERGILSAGRLLMCMAGFIVLAPAIAMLLAPFISPFFRAIRADPSLFASIIISNDSGGAALAAALADDPLAGRLNGHITASMLGGMIMYNIPLVLQEAEGEKRPAAVYGLLAGVITIPIGTLVGGLVGGFPFEIIIRNTIPVLFISILLGLLLIFASDKIVPLFQGLSRGASAVSVMGIGLGTIKLLMGLELVPGLGDLYEPFTIVGGICVVLAGMFPLMAVVKRVFARQFEWFGQLLNIDSTAVGGLVVALVNSLPAFSMLTVMGDRGRMVCTAFFVSGAFVLGDHLAFAAQTAPDLLPAVMAGKMSAGVASIIVALLLAPVLLKKETT